MINKILETLYSKVFINIISSDSQSTVYVEVCSKDKVLNSESETFKTSTMNEKMLSFVKMHTQESPYHYVTLLDKSSSQGVIPSCQEISKYTDVKNPKTICVDNKYALYTSAENIKEIKYEYKSVGLDFIFSPFSILKRFFKDKIDNHLAIFALIEENKISLSIYDSGQLLYAKYLNMHDEISMNDDLIMDTVIDEDDISLELDDVNLDDIDVDDSIGSLEDFGNIEDLDSGLDIDEFSEEEEIVAKVEENHDMDSVNHDYKRFMLIQESINDFYHDELYNSEFMEHIYIADSIGISNDLKKYLEEEMFLNVIVRKIALVEELCDMAKAEVV